MPQGERDTDHTDWSDPREHADALAALPTDPAALADALEEFVIHHAAARAMGFGVPERAERDRGLRTAERLVATALARDPRPLTVHRDLPDYLYGTCHDFALLAASVLRSAGVAARLRVGFADYLKRGAYDDHWVCEYRDGTTWRLLDAQLGRRARDGFGISFNHADVPRDRFHGAATVWQRLRAGVLDPAHVGVSFAGIVGTWFAASNVMKDCAALAGVEVLPWDYWGPARRFAETRMLDDHDQRMIDALAQALEPPPETRADAAALAAEFPWAIPGEMVASFAAGAFHEMPIRPDIHTS